MNLQPNQLSQFTVFKKLPDVQHGISNRHTEAAFRPTAHVDAEQVHGHQFCWVERLPALAGEFTKKAGAAFSTGSDTYTVPGVDALLTGVPGVRLRVGVSDCAPILVYDARARRGGVVHAGFKGTSQEILSRVLRELDPAQTYVGIGPTIGPCCYHEIDIQTENVAQALEAGVAPERIEVMPICTRCRADTYFSYRAGDTQNFSIYFELRS